MFFRESKNPCFCIRSQSLANVGFYMLFFFFHFPVQIREFNIDPDKETFKRKFKRIVSL